MKRYFNTTGYCRPDKHYMVSPIRGIKNDIYDLIENEQYFLIHAPRQTGKTTLLHALARQINSEDKYICIPFSIENAGYRNITVKDAMNVYVRNLYSAAKFFLPQTELPPTTENIIPNETLLYDYLQMWSEQQSKPIVLLIDEIDSVWDDVLISTLRQLRNGFQYRPSGFPVSIALVGLRDIREYKTKIKTMDGEMGSGSPFNIKAESFRLGSFTKEQVTELYNQHTEDTGQKFSSAVIDLVYEYTGGQPWLVNALANEIVAKILKKDFGKEITTEIVDTAKENLIQRRDTHLDSLMDKLQEERVKNIIQGIISGEIPNSDTYNNDLQYTIDLGIVTETKRGIVISNKIYSEIIPRVLNKNMQDGISPIIEPQWFIKGGRLDMDFLLKEFQQFYRENAESWIDRFHYQECGQQLLLMAFLQRILNGDGKIDREMALGRTRTDLFVKFGGDKFVLELKIKRKNYNAVRALNQLSGYLDKVGLKHGYLIAFNEKTSNEIPWEERIKWQDVEHEFMGVKRNITLVEM